MTSLDGRLRALSFQWAQSHPKGKGWILVEDGIQKKKNKTRFYV